MQLLTAKIVWFPNYLGSITEDYLENKIEWEKDHLNNVRQYMKEDGLLFPGVVMYNKHVKKMELDLISNQIYRKLLQAIP
jgi:hypothetical protein